MWDAGDKLLHTTDVNMNTVIMLEYPFGHMIKAGVFGIHINHSIITFENNTIYTSV